MAQPESNETTSPVPKILTTAELPNERTRATTYLPQLCFLLLELNKDWRPGLKNRGKLLLLGRFEGTIQDSDDYAKHIYINISQDTYGEAAGVISKRHLTIDPQSKAFTVYEATKSETEYEDANQHFIAVREREYTFNDGGRFIIGSVRVIVKLVENYVLHNEPFRLTAFEPPATQISEVTSAERGETTLVDAERDEKGRKLEQAIFEAVRPLLQNRSTEDIRAAILGASRRLTAQFARDEHVDQACNAIIQEIRDTARTTEHPTKLEQVLEIFREANYQGVTIDSLTHLYEDRENERKAASNTIVKLNEKLVGYDLQIVPIHNYHIISMKQNFDKL